MDIYSILGVNKTSKKSEVKKAYRERLHFEKAYKVIKEYGYNFEEVQQVRGFNPFISFTRTSSEC